MFEINSVGRVGRNSTVHSSLIWVRHVFLAALLVYWPMFKSHSRLQPVATVRIAPRMFSGPAQPLLPCTALRWTIVTEVIQMEKLGS